jgi:hypothetical protein
VKFATGKMPVPRVEIATGKMPVPRVEIATGKMPVPRVGQVFVLFAGLKYNPLIKEFLRCVIEPVCGWSF